MTDGRIGRVDVVYEAIVGSTVHGLALPGVADRDQLGIFVEKPPAILGLHTIESVSIRTQPAGRKSGPGDLDRSLHGLRKFCRLALGGNPTTLLLFFVPPEHVVTDGVVGAELRSMAHHFASLRSAGAFRGYLKHQLERMEGRRGGRGVKRPDLVAAHGYDTKYAMHALRLGFQGLEYLTAGRITLPMEEPVRVRLMAVRRGEVSQADVLSEIRDVEARLEGAARENPLRLPEQPEEAAVDRWLTQTYLDHWRMT
jgi:uncharacterized protein